MICLPKSLIGKCLKCGHFSVKQSLICLNKRALSSALDTNDQILDVNKFREDNGITCSGESVPDPVSTFAAFQWPQVLENRIKYLKFLSPTPVQSQSLPVIFSYRDLVAIASSGSGKTLAFVLPAIMKSMNTRVDNWPKCLIMAPTRELTHQIDKVVKTFRVTRSICLYGGVSHEIQEMLLKKANPHVVIATPDRLQVILERKIASLKHLDYVVIDEADRMLQMGYESAFRKVMQLLPKNRQTLMFSATWPPSVQKIADEFLRNYIHVSVSKNKSMESLTVNSNIEQIIRICRQSEKSDQFIEAMNELVPTISGYIKTIIFVRQKKTADKLVKLLKKENFPARALHSDKEQPERDFIMREFRKGGIAIIVATDVAARGLDFHNVRLVINYDFPSNIEDYIHRIGRTGRYKDKGKAVTFFTNNDICHKSSLINVLQESQQMVDQRLIDLTEEPEESEESSDKNEDSGYDSSEEYESNEEEVHQSDTESSNSFKNFDNNNNNNCKLKTQ